MFFWNVNAKDAMNNRTHGEKGVGHPKLWLQGPSLHRDKLDALIAAGRVHLVQIGSAPVARKHVLDECVPIRGLSQPREQIAGVTAKTYWRDRRKRLGLKR